MFARYEEPSTYPADAPRGPIVAITDEYASSGGDGSYLSCLDGLTVRIIEAHVTASGADGTISRAHTG
jgi:hypothetical protein